MDRERVMKGLDIILNGCDEIQCEDCCFNIKEPAKPRRCGIDEEQIHQDALDLLKELEAHVLTLDEAVDGNGCYYVEFQYHPDMGWVKCDFSRMYLDGEVAMLFTRDKNFYQQKEHYGQLWRLWNKRPTYDQRQAVKWE